MATLQDALFEAVFSELQGVGYTGDLLQRRYGFRDWFVEGNPIRVAPAAAFGQTPLAYDSACFAVLRSGEKNGVELVQDARALGSPFAFEVQADAVAQWVVGRDAANTVKRLQFGRDQVAKVFRDHQTDWTPRAILRAKNISIKPPSRQRDFIDLGLIPALEDEIRPKLDAILREALHNAKKTHIESTGRQPDDKELYRLVFRVLAAKVLHDRGVPGFESLTEVEIDAALEKVGRYYRAVSEQVLQDPATRRAVGSHLWKAVDFTNLSVEVLAYIYENTLVDPEIRTRLATHGTPHGIARYMVRNLPIGRLRKEERLFVEPCSGHAIFLVAALHRLREILREEEQEEMDPAVRHAYFIQMLRGFEIDAFAWEVSKLCLMLADFPNHNGWKLYNEDVFLSKSFNAALREAKIVLCNPPYGNFTKSEREEYGDAIHPPYKKPIEVLNRTLDNLPNGGMLGFVLPYQFVDGNAYAACRRRLAERFASLQIVELPEENVFRISRHKAVLVLASGSKKPSARVAVDYRVVTDATLAEFLGRSEVARGDRADKTAEEAEAGLAVIQLKAVWEHLSNSPKLDSIVSIHRGIEWHRPKAAGCYSDSPRPGFREGYGRADAGDLEAYLHPQPTYLNVEPANLKYNAIRHPWGERKVFVNAARISVLRWRHVAFLDNQGLLGTQNFHAVWLRRGAPYNLETLAAILNNPLAAAFVTATEKGKHNTIQTFKALPLPPWGIAEGDQDAIRALVREYAAAPAKVKRFPDSLRGILLRIDATVLKAYDLPPRLERELLDFFRGDQRPVSFDFGDYFPANFRPCIPLAEYISEDFRLATAREFKKKHQTPSEDILRTLRVAGRIEEEPQL